MRTRFVFIGLVCMIAAFLVGAWIGASYSSSTVTQDDWIAAIESGGGF